MPQEDAIVLNERSVQLGLFHSIQYDAYSKTGVCPPSEQTDDEPTLDEDGTAPLVADIPSGRPLAHDHKGGMVRQAMRRPARVDGVLMSEAHTLGRPHRATVRTVQYRVAVVGDKLCSRCVLATPPPADRRYE